VLYFYAGRELQALRSGQWKLHLPHAYLTVAAEPGRGGKPSNWGQLEPKSIQQSGLEGIASRHGYRVENIELSLFDLSQDPGEKHNLAAEHPEVVKRLQALADLARKDLGDKLTVQDGANIRPVGRAEE
jgi:arylsulfatase